MTNNFSINLASVPDREELVAEIWVGHQLVMEISSDNDDLRIEIYQSKNGNPWNFSYKDFVTVLDSAKNKLLTR
jgi:hypothetical protein